jgi:hypothetical protein
LLICEQLLACPDRLLSPRASLLQNLRLYNCHVTYVMQSVLAHSVCQSKTSVYQTEVIFCICKLKYQRKYKIINTGGADKSLARPGRKQATATEDFDVRISNFNHNWRNISAIYIYIYIYIYPRQNKDAPKCPFGVLVCRCATVLLVGVKRCLHIAVCIV